MWSKKRGKRVEIQLHRVVSNVHIGSFSVARMREC